ncbi:MAG: hypothetical protein ACJ71Z_12385 [Aeromicrobium sp.]
MVRPSASIALRRTDENAAEIAALASRVGEMVGVEGVFANLNRQARPIETPGSAVTRAYAWEGRDDWDSRWWPQGITWSTDVSVSEGVIVTSAYAKNRAGITCGSRIAIVDMATLRYRHVLLVRPVLRGRRATFRPLRVHAGGLVWFGPSYLHVAGSRRGILTCRMEDILAVPPSRATLGHRYILPVRFAYAAAAGNMTYSFLSLDRSVTPPELVAGEYGRESMPTRLARFEIDGDWLTTHTAGASAPTLFDDRGLAHMQGAVSVEGTWYVTQSRGPQGLGQLQVGQPGAFRRYPGALPIGPEDITYWPARDELWSQTEHPGSRCFFAMDRSQFA